MFFLLWTLSTEKNNFGQISLFWTTKKFTQVITIATSSFSFDRNKIVSLAAIRDCQFNMH